MRCLEPPLSSHPYAPTASVRVAPATALGECRSSTNCELVVVGVGLLLTTLEKESEALHSDAYVAVVIVVQAVECLCLALQLY